MPDKASRRDKAPFDGQHHRATRLWVGLHPTAITIVLPSANASAEGNGNNIFPFDIQPPAFDSQRYEQVYGASDFGSSTLLITGLAFRPDAQFGSAFSTTLTNLSIFLMTTRNAPDGLSAVFADNEGADKMLVHSGSLSLSSADIGPPGGPKAFDIIINLTTAFLYNPASGNLLLEVQNFSGGATTAFDGENMFGDPVSRVVTLDVNGVNDTTGSADTFGLVTEFLAVSVVPEPPSIALFGSAALVFAAMRRRRGTLPIDGEGRGGADAIEDRTAMKKQPSEGTDQRARTPRRHRIGA